MSYVLCPSVCDPRLHLRQFPFSHSCGNCLSLGASVILGQQGNQRAEDYSSSLLGCRSELLQGPQGVHFAMLSIACFILGPWVPLFRNKTNV